MPSARRSSAGGRDRSQPAAGQFQDWQAEEPAGAHGDRRRRPTSGGDERAAASGGGGGRRATASRGGGRGRTTASRGGGRGGTTASRGGGRGGASGSRGGGRPRRAPGGSDLTARVIVAVPAAIVAIVLIDLGGLIWALFMVLVACVCLNELYRLLARWRPAPAVGYAVALAMILVARFGSEHGVFEIAVASLAVAFLVIAARGQTGMATVSIAGTLLGVWWIALAFAHAVLLRRLDHGAGVLIDVLIGTFLGDTAAYLGGRLFGRRPLAPSISPNKTVEGLFCGMLIAIVAVFVAGLNQPWLTQGDALLLGIVVAVLGPIGDLFESLVKREADAKDSGGVFGAHGGALDRLDSVIFTVVAGYYVWFAILH